MRISLNKLLVTAAFGFVVGCAPGTTGGDAGEAECTSDLDCEGTDQCHPTLGICLQDCTLDTADACPAEAPVCNEADPDSGEYPLEVADEGADEAFRLLCVCIDDSDCGEGEMCDTETRECVEGEGTGDTCEEDTDCAEGEVCANGTCEAECFDLDCAANGDLCVLDPTDPEYNQCVIAESETATCADADDAPAQSGPPHVVVYLSEELVATPAGCQDANDNDLTLRTWGFDVYSDTAITADDVYRANFDAGNGRFFDHANATTVEDLGDGDFFVTVDICGNPNGVALYIETADAVSNAYCFDTTE